MTQANRALIVVQTKRGSKRGHYVLVMVLTFGSLTVAAAEREQPRAPQVSAVTEPQKADAQQNNVTELRFRDLFRLPVGPKGLEPTERLRALDGKQVRMMGYMVHQEQPMANRLILAAMPISMSEDEDGLADDLPPNVVFVHLLHSPETPMAYQRGVLKFTGTLSVRPKEEVDGRVSSVRLLVEGCTPAAMSGTTCP